MLAVAIAGFGILVALGILVGRSLDRRAQDRAWRGIAAARQRNAEYERVLDERAADLEDAGDALDRARRIGAPRTSRTAA